MIYPDFKDIEFPKSSDIVYILYFRHQDDGIDIPFYVGESSRHFGRFGDYISANFTAATDFKVGEAIKYIQSFKFHVGAQYKETNNRKEEEKQIIKELSEDYLLLNDLAGFHYSSANIHEEKIRIHNFVGRIINESRNIDKNDPKENGTESAGDNEAVHHPGDRRLSIPKIVEEICEELGADGKTIYRDDILMKASQYDINENSILPADYCDNTTTGKWSKHSFLHSLEPGKYILSRFKEKRR